MLDAILNGFDKIWVTLILLGVLVTIHELGHYWAARWFDVKIEAFSFGFGPRLFGFRRGETDFRFSLIPLGGYVKMSGEQPGEETDDPRAFLNKPRWQRLIIAFAGPFMNIVLAVGLLTGLFMHSFQRMVQKPSPVIARVLEKSAAAEAGVKEGDRVVEFDGFQNPTWQEIVLRSVTAAKRPVQVVVERDGQRLNLTITPKANEQEHVGEIGWGAEQDVIVAGFGDGESPARNAGLAKGDVLKAANGRPVRLVDDLNSVVRGSQGRPVRIGFQRAGQWKEVDVTPVWTTIETEQRWALKVQLRPAVETVQLGLGDALSESLKRNGANATLIYRFLQGMLERRISPKSLQGPIGIAAVAQEAARDGLYSYLEFMAMLSLNLAIFNLLPIPILDGGVILLLLVEMVRRQDLSLRVKDAIVKAGFAFLMVVVAFVLYNDITRSRPEPKGPHSQQTR
jgi:regulator of sigma E protease